MKPVYLFPNKLKIPALILFLISFALLVLYYAQIKTELYVSVFAFVSDSVLDSSGSTYFGFTEEDVYNEILDCTFFISGIVLAFSKEKIEDEMITNIRLKSLVYTTYFIFTLLIIGELFVFGFSFLNIMMGFLYSFIILTNLFYYINLFIYKKQFSHENED